MYMWLHRLHHLYWPVRTTCASYLGWPPHFQVLNWQQQQQQQRHRWFGITSGLTSAWVLKKRSFVSLWNSTKSHKYLAQGHFDKNAWLSISAGIQLVILCPCFHVLQTCYWHKLLCCLCASVTVFLTPHLLPPCMLLATEQCVYLSFCHIALVINATAPALEVSFSNGDFTPLDVICSDKPTEAILLLQLGRDNPSWCHITGGKSCWVYLCNKNRHYSLVNCGLLLCSQTPTSAISLLFLSVWLMCASLGLK